MQIKLSDHFTYKKLLRFTLPYFRGIGGIWLSLVVAEIMAVAVSALFFMIKRTEYRYF